MYVCEGGGAGSDDACHQTPQFPELYRLSQLIVFILQPTAELSWFTLTALISVVICINRTFHRCLKTHSTCPTPTDWRCLLICWSKCYSLTYSLPHLFTLLIQRTLRQINVSPICKFWKHTRQALVFKMSILVWQRFPFVVPLDCSKKKKLH